MLPRWSATMSIACESSGRTRRSRGCCTSDETMSAVAALARPSSSVSMSAPFAESSPRRLPSASSSSGCSAMTRDTPNSSPSTSTSGAEIAAARTASSSIPSTSCDALDQRWSTAVVSSDTVVLLHPIPRWLPSTWRAIQRRAISGLDSAGRSAARPRNARGQLGVLSRLVRCRRQRLVRPALVQKSVDPGLGPPHGRPTNGDARSGSASSRPIR